MQAGVRGKPLSLLLNVVLNQKLLAENSLLKGRGEKSLLCRVGFTGL